MKRIHEIESEIFNSSPDALSPEQKAKLYAELDAAVEREKAEQLEREWLAVCPKIYNEALDFSKIDPKNHTLVRSIVEWKSHPKGLFIIGPTGRAKTRACWAALKPRWTAGASVFYASSFQLAQDAVKSITDHEKGHKVLPRYLGVSILFLDDVGKRLTPSAAQFLFEIIERRTSNGSPIICTSNETPATLAQAIGDSTMSDPIIRRIREFCDLIVLP